MLEFFDTIGFKCPGQGAADFLQQVCLFFYNIQLLDIKFQGYVQMSLTGHNLICFVGNIKTRSKAILAA